MNRERAGIPESSGTWVDGFITTLGASTLLTHFLKCDFLSAFWGCRDCLTLAQAQVTGAHRKG